MTKILGLDELNKKLKELKNIPTKKALLAGAFTLQRYAQENAPVKTGFLRASAESVETENGAEMRFNANYAFYVEYDKHPFVRPALDQNQTEIIEAIKAEMQKEIKGVL